MKILLILSLITFSLCQSRFSNCHFTCSTCSKKHDATACTSCASPARLKKGRCTCPEGMGMTKHGTCEDCDPSCSTCVLADTKTHCHTCRDPSAILTKVNIACPMIFPPPPECDWFEKETGICVCPSGRSMGDAGYCERHSTQTKTKIKCLPNSHLAYDRDGAYCECKKGYYFDAKKPACIPYR